MERTLSRRHLLEMGLGGTVALSAFAQENKHIMRATALSPLSPMPQGTKLFVPGVSKDTWQTVEIPVIAKDAQPPAPPQPEPAPKTPEYRRSTQYIAEKPVWTKEFMSDKDTGVTKRINTTKPVIALTIDDGFSREAIKKILAIAIAKKITFTDFMKGQQRDLNPDLVQLLLESELVEPGTHTQEHRDERNGPIPGVPPTREQLTADILTPETLINKFGFTTLPYNRPPGGAVSPWTIDVSGSIGFRSILWSASADAGSTTDVRSLRPGDIVLMHYRDDSAAQFANWIDAVRRQGLEPTALSNVFAAEGK